MEEHRRPNYALRQQRLLRDIAELRTPPLYPNIRFVPHENDIKKACLVLAPKKYLPRTLHLSMEFHHYPMGPPYVGMDTPNVKHPNVYEESVCASILNQDEKYTSAYTIKALSIQMLSFFASDVVEQDDGDKVRLADFNEVRKQPKGSDWEVVGGRSQATKRRFTCRVCGYDSADVASMQRAAGIGEDASAETKTMSVSSTGPRAVTPGAVEKLSDDVLLLMMEGLSTDDVVAFAAASGRVGRLVAEQNLVRKSGLVCFCLKTSYRQSDLGIGVTTIDQSRKPTLQSEFDLLSREAFFVMGECRSGQSLKFQQWLPLPLSRRHWLRVRDDVVPALYAIGKQALPAPLLRQRRRAARKKARGRARGPPAQGEPETQALPLQPLQAWQVGLDGEGGQVGPHVSRGFDRYEFTGDPDRDPTAVIGVLYAFMANVVERFTDDVGDGRDGRDGRDATSDGQSRSTLRHASEKAMEAYCHLFHLLVCLATEHPAVAEDARRRIHAFSVGGRRHKNDCPDLRVLLMALLIADARADDEPLTKAIVTEAITRNVVWLLDEQGAGRTELAYLEPDGTVSEYRLHHSFVGTLASYRLLMFIQLFRRIVRSGAAAAPSTVAAGEPRPLEAIRDDLFQRCGAPPPAALVRLVAEVRRLQAVRTWPEFLRFMGITMPTKVTFCDVLRAAVRNSMDRGYSVWALSQDEAALLREQREAEEAQPSTKPTLASEQPKQSGPTDAAAPVKKKVWNFFPRQ